MGRVLVTGSNGFIGSYIVKQLLDDGHEVFATSRNKDLSSFTAYSNYHFLQMDFTNPFDVHDTFETVKPAIVVHCGAMSKPDDCELNQSLAYSTNVEAVVHLLLNAAEYNSFFIHFSTDFIFNGNGGMHTEEAIPDPISYYGKTKLEAEEVVMKYESDWAIVRTVFVYGRPLFSRDSFVTMIAKKLQNKESYKVVNDQERTPTFVTDLAKGISLIIEKKATGIFHLCGKNIMTPYQMAVETAKILNLDASILQPVTCNEFKEIARRPLKSGLSIEKAKHVLGYEPLSFNEGIRQTFFDDLQKNR